MFSSMINFVNELRVCGFELCVPSCMSRVREVTMIT